MRYPFNETQYILSGSGLCVSLLFAADCRRSHISSRKAGFTRRYVITELLSTVQLLYNRQDSILLCFQTNYMPEMCYSAMPHLEWFVCTSSKCKQK
jgi:hypothetical protein